MQNKDYQFCGCSIRLSCSQSIIGEGNYLLFCCDRPVESPVYSVTVIPTTQLPKMEGTPDHVTHRRSYYDKKDCIYTSFYDLDQNTPVNHACMQNNTKLWIIPQDDTLGERSVFDGLDLPSMLLNKGIGILHCSFVAYQGGALLFAGDKQVGKSTQAALWQTYKNATVVNGDRAGVYEHNGTFFAGGVPFCGTSGICLNRQLPIRAIVCLGKGPENQLEKLSVLDGFKELIGKFSYNHRPVETEQILSLSSALAEQVPVYRYTCLKDQSAVEFLEQQLF